MNLSYNHFLFGRSFQRHIPLWYLCSWSNDKCCPQTFSRKIVTSAGKCQKSLPASYYRGGTSRAIFFCQEDLPTNRNDWNAIFRATIGSPDPNGRQLDGLGGGISSLSKICIVGPSQREDADIDYTFVSIGVKNGDV